MGGPQSRRAKALLRDLRDVQNDNMVGFAFEVKKRLEAGARSLYMHSCIFVEGEQGRFREC